MFYVGLDFSCFLVTQIVDRKPMGGDGLGSIKQVIWNLNFDFFVWRELS